MLNGQDGVVKEPVGVPGVSGQTVASPLEPVIGVGKILGGADSGVTAATFLEQVAGDGGLHRGAGGERQAALQTKLQQPQRLLAQIQAQLQATAASATEAAVTPRIDERSVPPPPTPAVTESVFRIGMVKILPVLGRSIASELPGRFGRIVCISDICWQQRLQRCSVV